MIIRFRVEFGWYLICQSQTAYLGSNGLHFNLISNKHLSANFLLGLGLAWDKEDKMDIYG